MIEDKPELFLDLAATICMVHAQKANKEWDCQCGACCNLRQKPRVLAAILKAFERNKEAQIISE